MLTGVRRSLTQTAKAQLRRPVSKAMEILKVEKGDEYLALKRLAKDRGSRARAWSRKSSHIGEVFIRDRSRFNIYTPKLMEDVKDYLEWMEFDGYMRFVRFASDDPSLISSGTDFKTIEYGLENNDSEQVVNYLRNLQNFCSYLVGYNKPCIFEFEGTVYNSAAASLLQMPYVNYHSTAQAIFNEALRGSTLLGGSSYVLSRMPPGVGKYLALTGAPITGADLFHFGLCNLDIKLDSSTLHDIEEECHRRQPFRSLQIMSLLPPMRGLQVLENEDLIMSKQRELNAQDLVARMEAGEDPSSVMLELVTKDVLSIKANQAEHTAVGNNWERRLRDLNNLNMLHTIENRLGSFEEEILQKVIKKQEFERASIANDRGEISEHASLMRNAFATDNIEVVKNNLRKSKTSWALKTLESLEKIDPSLANRIMKQIDYATENDYVSCLIHEFNTAIDYYSDVTDCKFDKSRHTYSPKSPVKALLPVREYYKEFPDAVRMTLSCTHNSDPFVFKNFPETVSTFLNLHGIDVINPVTSLDVAREVLWRRKQIKREMAMNDDFKNAILDSVELKAAYLDSRRSAIDAFMEQEEVDYQVQRAIASAFNKKFEKTQNHLKDQFEKVQLLTRKNHLKDLRSMMLESRITPKRTDLEKKTSRLSAGPMEVVDDPLNVPRSIQDKYYISERVDLLTAKYELDADKVDDYLKGKNTQYDLISVKLRDRNQTSIYTDNYFRDYVYVPNKTYFIKYRSVFLSNLNRGNGEDPREVEFREQYIEDQVSSILCHINLPESAKRERAEEVRQSLRQLLFDYLDDKDSLFEYKDPHLSNKPEKLDVKNSLTLHKLAKERTGDFKLDSKTFEEISDLTDLRLDRAGEEGSLDLRGSSPTNIEDYIKTNFSNNPFLEEKVGWLFTTTSGNPVVSRVIDNSRKLLLAVFKKHLQKYASDMSMIVTYPELRGDTSNKKFMSQIDSFLSKNLELDFFDMVASDSLREFTHDCLDSLDDLFESAYKDVKTQSTDDWIAKKPMEDFSDLKEANFVKALSELAGVKSLSHEEVDECLKFLDEWLFTLAEIKEEYKKEEFDPSIQTSAQNLTETERITKFFKDKTDTSLIKTQTTKKNKLSKVVERLVKERKLTASFLENEGSKQKAIREKMIKCVQVNPSSDNYDNVLKTYQHLKANYNENEKIATCGSVSLIFELETIIKEMREGKESGVDDDYSKLSKILHDSYISPKETPEAWVQSRITEYFETLFGIREQFEPYLTDRELYYFDVSFNKYFKRSALREMLLSELEKDMIAFEMIRNVEKANEAKNADIDKMVRNPKLMAFTLKNRIVNTVAFKAYRTLFITLQSKLDNMLWKKGSDRYNQKLEGEILKVHLARLFKESQRPQFHELSYRYVNKELSSEPIRADTTIMNPVDGYEDELKKASIIMAKSVNTSKTDTILDSKIRDEVSRLIDRMKIYGIN